MHVKSYRFALRFLLCACILSACAPAALRGEETTLVYPPRSHALGHRATSTHLRIFLGSDSEFDAPKGIACTKLENWDDPGNAADDDELFLVLVNSGRKEILYNNSMITVAKAQNGGELQLSEASDVAVDTRGNVYVADTGLARVTKLTLDEKNRLAFAGHITGEQAERGKLLEPVGLCVSHDGKVYVADRGKNSILCFDPQGKLLDAIEGGTTGEKGLFKPIDVDVMSANDPWNFFKLGGLYVIDMDGRRIQSLSMNGERQAVFYSQDLPAAGSHFHSLALDYHCQVYVTDPANHCIHKFDRNLRHLATFGKRGTGDREFQSPTGIAIWKRFGQLFVADATGAQYFWIGTDIPGGDGSGPSARLEHNAKGRKEILLTFDITEPSEISVALLSKKEEIPLLEWRRYYPVRLKLSLPLPLLADGDLEGAHLVVRARAVYSSKGNFEKKVTVPVSGAG
jgi:DNA-binding beta-propeller fold protein YncE